MVSKELLIILCSSIMADHNQIQPKSQAVFEGEHVSFECDSQVNTKWFFLDSSNDALIDIPLNARVRSNTLYIDNVQRFNEGFYECQGEKDEYDESTHNIAKFAARALLQGMLQFN